MKLIADSGSTKTVWRLLDNSQSLQEFFSLGMNPYFWTQAQILEELEHSVRGHVQSLDLQEVHFYGAGCSSEAKQQEIKTALQVFFGDPAPIIHVQHDMLAAARALCGAQPGVVCILGTGANACFFDGQQITWQPINLGFWLGDEGSGGWLGKQIVIDYLHGLLPKRLQGKFKEQYHDLTLEHVLQHAYEKPFPNRFFAQFSEFIHHNIINSYCSKLVYLGFSEFLKKYILPCEECHNYQIHFTGSVAYHYQDILLKALHNYELKAGRIFISPIEGLTVYHLNS